MIEVILKVIQSIRAGLVAWKIIYLLFVFFWCGNSQANNKVLNWDEDKLDQNFKFWNVDQIPWARSLSSGSYESDTVWRLNAYYLARVARTDEEKIAALLMAARSNSLHLIRQVHKQGLDVNSRGYRNRTALMLAAYRNMRPALQLLLLLGANPNLQDDEGNTALHVIDTKPANDDRDAIFLDLLRYGSDPNLINRDGQRPHDRHSGVLDDRILSLLQRRLPAEEWRKIIQRQLDSTSRSLHRSTHRVNKYYEMGARSNAGNGRLLYNAMHPYVKGYYDKAYEHLKHGANPNSKINRDLLKKSIEARHSKNMAALLEFGANPNQLFPDGGRPLHLAAKINDQALVRILLFYGANPDLKDKHGKPAYAYCKQPAICIPLKVNWPN